MPKVFENQTSINPDFDDLISLKEAAQIGGLSADHLRRLVERGDLWGKKIGRNWVTSKQAIHNYLAKDRQPGRKPKKTPNSLDI
jgi:excisionase family DNA binding protein